MKNLVHIRRFHGLSQKELAALVGISATTISRAERDDNHVSVETAKRLAAFFHITLDNLVNEDVFISFKQHKG